MSSTIIDTSRDLMVKPVDKAQMPATSRSTPQDLMLKPVNKAQASHQSISEEDPIQSLAKLATFKVLPKRVVAAIMECRHLQLDLIERSLLETIILARKDCCNPLIAPSHVDLILEQAQTTLEQHIIQVRSKETGAFGRTLLVLPRLRSIPQKLLLENVIGLLEEDVNRLF